MHIDCMLNHLEMIYSQRLAGSPLRKAGTKRNIRWKFVLKTTKSFLGTNFNSSLKSLLMHLPFFSPQSFTVHTFRGGGGTGTGTVRGTGIVFTFVKYLSCIMIWGTGTAADAEQKRICPWQKTEKVCLLAKRMVSKLLLCQALWANNLLCGFPEAPGNSRTIQPHEPFIMILHPKCSTFYPTNPSAGSTIPIHPIPSHPIPTHPNPTTSKDPLLHAALRFHTGREQRCWSTAIVSYWARPP